MITRVNLFQHEETTTFPAILYPYGPDRLRYLCGSFLGEFADIIWAPASSIIFFISFGGWKGALGGIGNFIEELLPGTDFIPSFTLMWLLQQSRRKNVSSPARFYNR